MITSKEYKIKIPENFSPDYIESQLKNTNYDILSWAIVSFDDEYYYLNLSIVV